MKASIETEITLVGDTAPFEKALDRIIEIIGLPEEEPPTEETNGQETD